MMCYYLNVQFEGQRVKALHCTPTVYLWVWHVYHSYLGLKKESNRRFGKTNRIMKIFMIFSPSKILFGDQFKTNEMGGTCGTDRGEAFIQDFGG